MKCRVLIIGHVTKEGAIAGPRVVEHMVDAVLYFESDPSSRYTADSQCQEPLRREWRDGCVCDDRVRLSRGQQSVGHISCRAIRWQSRAALCRSPGRAAGRYWSKSRRWFPTRRRSTRGGLRRASSRTVSRCCSPFCSGTAGCRWSTRTCSSTSSAGCVSRKRRSTCRLCWPSFRVFAIARCRKNSSVSVRSAWREKSGPIRFGTERLSAAAKQGFTRADRAARQRAATRAERASTSSVCGA